MRQKLMVQDEKFISDFLSKLLVLEYSLLIVTKAAYWNFKYQNLLSKKKFEEQSVQLNLLIEDIGRKIAELNQYVIFSKTDDFLFNNFNELSYQKWSKIEFSKQTVIKHLLIIKKIKDFDNLIGNQLDYKTKSLFEELVFVHKNLIKNLK